MTNQNPGAPRAQPDRPSAAAEAQARVERTIREAFHLLEQGRVEEARRPIDALARALGNDFRVTYLRRAAEVVSLDLDQPASRAPLALVRVHPPAPEMIDVVAFHADLPRPPSEIHAPVDYQSFLALSLEGARIRAPHARRVLLTDERTPVDPSIGVDRVMRFPWISIT